MDWGFISGIIIVFVVGVFAYKLLFKKDNKTNYISVLGKLVLFLIIVVAFGVFWGFFTRTQIYRNSIGSLYTDYKSSGKGGDASVDVLTITISLDSIQIDDSIYTNVLDAQQVIADAVNSGKNLRIIDDYALAKTYNDIINVIVKMNVSRSNIEEIQQP